MTRFTSAARNSCDYLSPVTALGLDNGVEQARKTGIHIVAAQGVQNRGSRVALIDQTRLAQDPEVMSRRGLRDRELEGDAGLVVVPARELRDDLAPDRIGQGGQDRIQGHCLDVGVIELSRHAIPPVVRRRCRAPQSSTATIPCSTINIVVRVPSYKRTKWRSACDGPIRT